MMLQEHYKKMNILFNFKKINFLLLLKERRKYVKNLKANYLIEISKNSFWLYTIPKSGTTLFINFLGKYLYCLKNKTKKYPYSNEIFEKLLHHTIHNQAKHKLVDLKPNKELMTFFGYNYFVSTHCIINNVNPKKTLLLYRDPKEYIYSIYNYKYLNRKGFNFPKIFGAKFIFKKYFKEYNDHILNFKKIKNKLKDNCLIVDYNDITGHQSDKYFKQILNFLEINFDKEIFEVVMHNISKKKYLVEERKNNNLLNEYLSGSFINNNKYSSDQLKLSKRYYQKNYDDVEKILKNKIFKI